MQSTQETTVKVNLVSDNANMPTKGSAEAAGFDLYAYTDHNIEVNPGETVKVSVGIKTEIPKGYVALIFARSGLATKQGLAPANKVAVIDSDYRGEWFVPLHNHGNIIRTVENGERIAQTIIMKAPDVVLEQVDSLSETERGEGGFGSTGLN